MGNIDARAYGKLFIHIQLIDSFFKKIFGVEHIRFKNFNGEIIIGEVKHPCVHSIVKQVNLQLIDDANDMCDMVVKVLLVSCMIS